MKQLRLFFQDTECQHFTWSILAADAVIERGDQDTAAFDKMAQKVKDVVFVLPHHWVYSTHIETEGKVAKHLLSAAAYQLEEQLGQDVDDLHFAQGNSHNSLVPFAVIKHELMQALIRFEQQHRMAVNTIISEMDLCATPEKGALNIVLLDDRCLIKSADSTESTVCAKDQLSFYLEHYFSQYAEHDRHVNDANVDLSLANIDLKVAVNLKQKSYSDGHAWQSMAKRYVFPWLLLFFSFALFMVTQWQENQSLQRVKVDIIEQQKALLKRSLRTYKETENPKRALIKALQQQQTGKQTAGFLSIFHQFLKLKQSIKSIKLKKVSYSNKKLTLDITAASLQDLDKLIEGLKKDGFSVKVSQMDASNNESKGRIVLERQQ